MEIRRDDHLKMAGNLGGSSVFLEMFEPMHEIKNL